MKLHKRGDRWHMDATVNGVRYREALDTTDKREAVALAQKRIAEIQAGKGASKAGREFARLSFGTAADIYLSERAWRVSERTSQLEKERLKPLRKFFGDRPVFRIKAHDIATYQKARRERVAGRTVNMEIGVLRQLMKRGKVWSVVAEDVQMERESGAQIARVLTEDQKRLLFATATMKPGWLVAHCAAVLAASTTCRGVELKGLRWRDVDLFDRTLTIRRSKTESGRRVIPLTGDALGALARLRERAEVGAAAEPEHFVFPSCEALKLDPSRPQKTWRTAWRRLTREAARLAGRAAATKAIEAGRGWKAALQAWRRAATNLKGFRFHDLRHQAITELAEAGASDATLMALAGHMSRRMLEHYSHVRMEAKRTAIAALERGGTLMGTRVSVPEMEPKGKVS